MRINQERRGGMFRSQNSVIPQNLVIPTGADPREGDDLRSGGTLCLTAAAPGIRLLSADSKFTQKRHHWAPVRESRLKQIQSDKSCEQVPVRAYVVPKRQGQQNKASSNQTQHPFYGHSRSPLN
jgi:hypothetical protein